MSRLANVPKGDKYEKIALNQRKRVIKYIKPEETSTDLIFLNKKATFDHNQRKNLSLPKIYLNIPNRTKKEQKKT